MKKTKKTQLTDEVRDALVEMRKKKTWESLPIVEAGYSPHNFSGVRQVLHNSMLNIKFVSSLLLMIDENRVETDHVIIEVEGTNYAALEDATYNMKMNLAAHKPEDMAWRELSLDYGYDPSSGNFARAVKGRKWAPVEMIYLMCKRFDQTKVSGEHDGVKITFTVKK